VLALAGWLNAARISEGPLFRAVTKGGAVSASRLSDQAVSLIVKARVASIGLPASTFSGHSLRAGLVTSAARAGVSLTKIQEQSGHRSIAMLARYIRDAKAFEGNASGLLL
jgi:integrase